METTLRTVDPSAIQDELSKLWDSLETANTTRACLFNLIFYTHKAHRFSYVQKIADHLVKKFPARIILIAVDTACQEEALTTSISILPSSPGEYDVACDLIQIETSLLTAERIPFIVLPHILSDLPVYLMWAEDPLANPPLLQQLEKFSSRLIFDSEAASNLPEFARNLLKSYQQEHMDIADLNWARIEDFRDLIAASFHSKERQELLSQISSLRIRYNSAPSLFFCHTRIQALFIQTWLATQLGWNFHRVETEADTLTLLYQGPIEVHIHPVFKPELPPGLVLSIEIYTQSDVHVLFEIQETNTTQIITYFSTPTICEMPSTFVCSKGKSGHSLIKEIYHRGTSPHFLKVLQAIEQMNIPHLC